jgi:hypothetical protein
MAERMVARFGVDIRHVIEDEPAQLTEVDGLGPRRTAMITAAWAGPYPAGRRRVGHRLQDRGHDRGGSRHRPGQPGADQGLAGVLTAEQERAVRLALTSRVAGLTGHEAVTEIVRIPARVRSGPAPRRAGALPDAPLPGRLRG